MTTFARLTLLSILFTCSAFAANVPKHNPCSKDIQKFCSKSKNVAQCMDRHASKLSKSCIQWGETYAKKHPKAASRFEQASKH